MPDFMDAFPLRVFPEPNTGCWLCVSSNNKLGYARIRHHRRFIGAHRVSYEMSRGSIPDGLEIDHLCRVTCCVNPDHLEAVTPLENQRRRRSAALRQRGFCCLNGHPVRPENVYRHPISGFQGCRECREMFRARHRIKNSVARSTDYHTAQVQP